jgi:hypothetical protein
MGSEWFMTGSMRKDAAEDVVAKAVARDDPENRQMLLAMNARWNPPQIGRVA